MKSILRKRLGLDQDVNDRTAELCYNNPLEAIELPKHITFK